MMRDCSQIDLYAKYHNITHIGNDVKLQLFYDNVLMRTNYAHLRCAGGGRTPILRKRNDNIPVEVRTASRCNLCMIFHFCHFDRAMELILLHHLAGTFF